MQNWFIWAVERQNWFSGAFGIALIFYMGRGCVSMISKKRRQRAGQIEGSEKTGGRSVSIDVPSWLAYILLILSTAIPAVMLAVVVIIRIIGAIKHDGIWGALTDIETIVLAIFVITGFLVGLLIWGILRMIMWATIEWLARLSHRRQSRQVASSYMPVRHLVDFILKKKGKRLKFIKNLLMDMRRKSLISDRRMEVAIREAIGKQKERILMSDLENLTKLDAKERKVIDLNGIEHCTNLQRLNLYDNQIGDISLLSNLTNLQELILTDGGIKNIRPLSSLTKLQVLRLGSNFITDVTPLRELMSLQELYLWNNQISSIGPLKNLTNLQRLGLGGNQIRNINSLKDLTNLQELVLTDNWIADITLLSDLTNLRKLYLAKNQIRDISPLVNNSGMGKGALVDLKDNPLNNEAYDIHIPALQERGVRVQFNPRL